MCGLNCEFDRLCSKFKLEAAYGLSMKFLWCFYSRYCRCRCWYSRCRFFIYTDVDYFDKVGLGFVGEADEADGFEVDVEVDVVGGVAEGD